jgi:Spy/CpxP family protein refolding chaperone
VKKNLSPALATGLVVLAALFGFAAFAQPGETSDGDIAAGPPPAGAPCHDGPGGPGAGPGMMHPGPMMMGAGGGGCCGGGPGKAGMGRHAGGAMGMCDGPDGMGPGAMGPAGMGRMGRMGGPGRMGRFGGPGSDAMLKEAFGLTEAQVASLKTLRETEKSSAEALQKQIADSRKALDEALGAAKPDAQKVGSTLIALRGYEKQLPKVHETFRDGFRAILTPAQKQKLAEAESVRAAQALRHVGL